MGFKEYVLAGGIFAYTILNSFIGANDVYEPRQIRNPKIEQQQTYYKQYSSLENLTNKFLGQQIAEASENPIHSPIRKKDKQNLDLYAMITGTDIDKVDDQITDLINAYFDNAYNDKMKGGSTIEDIGKLFIQDNMQKEIQKDLQDNMQYQKKLVNNDDTYVTIILLSILLLSLYEKI